MNSSKYKAVDLFSGCGGLSLGLMNAGIDVMAAFDNWGPALKVYAENFSHPIHDCDLTDVKSVCAIVRPLRPDFIVGGPPCQDFSSAGKRDETLGRANLTLSFAKVVDSIRPRWFIMENVERARKSKTLPKALAIFHEAGYGITQRVLDASLCGVPQKRLRLFVIGELGGSDEAIGPYLDGGLADKPMTIRECFGEKLKIDHYYRHPRSYKRRGIFSVDEPSPTVRGVNRPVPSGYPGHPGDTTPLSEEVRPLTTQERGMIQTFPKDFDFTGSKTNVEQLIGNAVPVRLAEHVGRAVRDYMRDAEEGAVKRVNGQMSLL